MPYLTTLKRDAGGCKIVVDGSCASQRLSQRFKGESNLTCRFAFETLASLNPSSNPSPLRLLQKVVVAREEEEERKKEEEEEERKKEEDVDFL